MNWLFSYARQSFEDRGRVWIQDEENMENDQLNAAYLRCLPVVILFVLGKDNDLFRQILFRLCLIY